MSLRKRSYLEENFDFELFVDMLVESTAVVGGKVKNGKWRRVANHNVFFPDDGSGPIGLPKMKTKKQKKKELKKTAKKVAFFNKLSRWLKRKK